MRGAADARARGRALAEAARLVSEDGHDLDAVLDALAEQARRLLAADGASLHLAEPGGLVVVRRPAPMAAAGTTPATPGARYAPTAPTTLEAMATRRAVATPDYQRDGRVTAEMRALFPSTGASLVVPLYAGDTWEGLLYVHWLAPRAVGEADLETAEALGAHAAVAVRTARLAEAARVQLARAHALADAVAVVSAGGHDLDATLDALAEQTRRLLGAADATINLWDAASDAFIRRGDSRLAAPDSRAATPGTHVQVGPVLTEALATRRPVLVADWLNDPRVSADAKAALPPVVASLLVPLVAGDKVLGTLEARWTEPPGLCADDLASAEALGRHAALAIRTQRLIAERARLDGAVMTGRLVAHELNNMLQSLNGYGYLLAQRLGGEEAEMAGEIVHTAREMAAVVSRLLRIVRFEEADSPVGPVLDLDASVVPHSRGP